MNEIENISSGEINSVTETTNLMCDITVTDHSKMPADSGYSEAIPELSVLRRRLTHNPSTSTVSAIALSGIPILNGVSADEVDAVEAEYTTMDTCLSHSTNTG